MIDATTLKQTLRSAIHQVRVHTGEKPSAIVLPAEQLEALYDQAFGCQPSAFDDVRYMGIDLFDYCSFADGAVKGSFLMANGERVLFVK